jgi:hypothetical protein
MAKRKIQKDKQRYIKHTHKTKDRVARTMSRDGPVALEFQLYENCDGQLVYPLACLVVNTIYLYKT